MAKITLTSEVIEVKESVVDLRIEIRNYEFIYVTQVCKRYNKSTMKSEEYDFKIWINKIHIIKFTD